MEILKGKSWVNFQEYRFLKSVIFDKDKIKNNQRTNPGSPIYK